MSHSPTFHLVHGHYLTLVGSSSFSDPPACGIDFITNIGRPLILVGIRMERCTPSTRKVIGPVHVSDIIILREVSLLAHRHNMRTRYVGQLDSLASACYSIVRCKNNNILEHPFHKLHSPIRSTAGWSKLIWTVHFEFHLVIPVRDNSHSCTFLPMFP